MTSWRPALRLAARDLRRHKVRAVLTAVLVALPVLVATVASLAAHNSAWVPERELARQLGSADAELVVAPFEAVRPRPALDLEPRRPTPDTERRDPATVDVPGLLPGGSRTALRAFSDLVALPTGGQAELVLADEDPLTAHLAEITSGRWPQAPAEVAVSAAAAKEFGLLDGEDVAAEALLTLSGGTELDVVGVLDTTGMTDGPVLLASVDSVLNDAGPRDAVHLVDLPAMTRAELKALHQDLAGVGVMLRPRDSMLHPGEWGLFEQPDTFDAAPLAVAATVIGVGALEVVLLVGAAFAIAARRQIRGLGLLAANGGASADVRRVLLAQGLVLGALSSVVGAAAGIAVFRHWIPTWEQLVGQEMWRSELDWRALSLILVLGTLSSFLAALIPAWTVSRLTPVAALSGRFPVQAGEAKAHRGALVLAAAGVLLLTVGGWSTARTFGAGGRDEILAPFVAGLGLLLLVVGVVWATPYLIRRCAELGRILPLTGRYALRDAGRHRFRSAGTVIALTVTVSAAVLAGFALDAALRAGSSDHMLPPQTMEIYLDTVDVPAAGEAAQVAVRRVLGPTEALTSYGVTIPDARERPIVLQGRRGSQQEVRIVSEETLTALIGRDPAVLAAFRTGTMVSTLQAHADLEQAGLRVSGPRRAGLPTWEVPVAAATAAGEASTDFGSMNRLLISQETATSLGLRASYGQMLVTAERPITRGDVERLRVYGLHGWSSDPDRADLRIMQYAGAGAAGLLALLVVGVAVGLSAAESKDDVATLAAVGAAPRQRRAFGAAHGLFLAAVGCVLGAGIGVAGGIALGQVDGAPGVAVPWGTTLGALVLVALAAAAAGWLVTPGRLDLTRRTG